MKEIVRSQREIRSGKGGLPIRHMGDRILNGLFHLQEYSGYREREYYNKDRSRKIVFYDWGKDRKPYQGNIVLFVSSGSFSWNSMMRVLYQTRGDKDFQAIELTGIYQGDGWSSSKSFLYEREDGGVARKRWTGMMFGTGNRESDVESMIEEGFLSENQLPELLDFDRTAESMLRQLLALDFSNPVLCEIEGISFSINQELIE